MDWSTVVVFVVLALILFWMLVFALFHRVAKRILGATGRMTNRTINLFRR